MSGHPPFGAQVTARDAGRLRQLCERWIYSTCLCFALDLEEQAKSSVSVLGVSDGVQPESAVPLQPADHKRKRNPTRWGVVVETTAYDLTVFKVHYGTVTLKIYTKGERVLRAQHDLKKLRSKGMVRKIGSSRRYEPEPDGLRAMTALVILREKVIRPLLAASQRPASQTKPNHPHTGRSLLRTSPNRHARSVYFTRDGRVKDRQSLFHLR
jgi:hypothetical protein